MKFYSDKFRTYRTAQESFYTKFRNLASLFFYYSSYFYYYTFFSTTTHHINTRKALSSLSDLYHTCHSSLCKP